MLKCNQDNCTNEAVYKFTWPGSDEKGICAEHRPQLESVAQAMGFHLQILPIIEELEHPC